MWYLKPDELEDKGEEKSDGITSLRWIPTKHLARLVRAPQGQYGGWGRGIAESCVWRGGEAGRNQREERSRVEQRGASGGTRSGRCARGVQSDYVFR